MRKISFLLLYAALLAPLAAHAADLSPREEAQWIAAVKQHITQDGATVWETLRYAEKLRPNEFKIGSVDVGYDGESGHPAGVGIGYFIGEKRLPGDEFIGLFYIVKKTGAELSVFSQTSPYVRQTITQAIEGGRESFLLYVDVMYQQTCVDSASKSPL